MIGRTLILSVAAIAGLSGAANTAHAGTRTDIDVSIRIGRPAPSPGRVWVEPVYETRCDRVWVEPVYETRCDRVWREPVYEDRSEQVWVEPSFELRVERGRDVFGRPVERQVRVQISNGHYETRCTKVLVCEGRWEEVRRQVCVSEGHWSEVSRQVCVRDGYWQDVAPPSRTGIAIDIGGSRRDDRGGYAYDDRRPSDDRRGYEPRRDDDRHDPRGDSRKSSDDDRSPRRGYDRGDRYASR